MSYISEYKLGYIDRAEYNFYANRENRAESMFYESDEVEELEDFPEDPEEDSEDEIEEDDFLF